ncbi:MAG: SBBP repeat-containing protein, partial [Candidatus Hodarchaeota archaeon]
MQKTLIWGLLLLACILIVLIPLYHDNSQTTETLKALPLVSSKLKAADVPLRGLQRQTEAKSVQMPFSGFIQNVGQLGSKQIHYYYTTPEMNVEFGSSTITLRYVASTEDNLESFSLSFPDAQLVNPVGQKKNHHYVNYFSAEWYHTHIPTWNEIWYKDLYPGIDLRYYMTDQGLKYDFVVQTGGDPSQITLQVSENMQLCVEDQCALIKAQGHHSQFQLQNTALKVWQPNGHSPNARFLLKNRSSNRYGFHTDFYNSSHKLTYSTLLGGTGDDFPSKIAVDASGAIYVVGHTYSSDFPTTSGAYDTIFNERCCVWSDIFVSKLSSNGSVLEYSTYLGGTSTEYAGGIAVDASGAVYVTGRTYSPDFPTTPGAYDTLIS